MANSASEEETGIELTDNGIDKLYQLYKKGDKKEILQLQVLDIKRFVADKTLLANMELTEQDCALGDCFDLVLSDGVLKTKCFLYPKLNPLIQQQVIVQYTVIEMTEWRILKDPATGSLLVIIRALARAPITEQPDSALSVHEENDQWHEPQWDTRARDHARQQHRTRDEAKSDSHVTVSALVPKRVEFSEQEAVLEYLECRPILGPRASYIGLYTQDTVQGSLWTRGPDLRRSLNDLADLFVTRNDRYATLAEIAALWQKSRAPKSLLNVIVVARVMSRSAIIHFASPAQYGVRWPVRCVLQISDSTGSASVVVWSSSVPKYWHGLAAGDAILLRDVKLKQSYDDPNTFELTVNPHSPGGVINVLEGPALDALQLPDLPMRLIGSNKLSVLADKTQIEHLGLVTYASPLVRIRNSSTLGFSAYRWLKTRDQHSDTETAVKLFANSQFERLDALQLGDVVLLTNMTVQQIAAEANSTTTFLESTIYSDIYVNEEVTALPLTRVKQFVRWFNDLSADFLDVPVPHYNDFVPPCPNTYVWSVVHHQPALRTPPLQFADLDKELEDLQPLERRFVVVRARIEVHLPKEEEHIAWHCAAQLLSPTGPEHHVARLMLPVITWHDSVKSTTELTAERCRQLALTMLGADAATTSTNQLTVGPVLCGLELRGLAEQRREVVIAHVWPSGPLDMDLEL